MNCLCKLEETPMISYKVTLTEDERSDLDAIKAKGSHRSKKVLNALILLNCDEGPHQTARSTNAQMSSVLGISDREINRVKKRFVEEGLHVALHGHNGHRVYNKKVNGDLVAKIIAVNCSEVPEGFSQWSLRMLADRVVELGYVDDISHETVRRVLKKATQTLEAKRMGNPTRMQQRVCIVDGA